MTAVQPLFSRPDTFVQRGLSILPRILDEVMPLNASQRRELQFACRDLSVMLTTERDALARPYWASPRLTSAYLRYFLPWNLVRLTALLPNLELGLTGREARLNVGPNDVDEPLILDLGSGPMTLPLALWLSRPDLRKIPLTVVCTDTSSHVLDLGRQIMLAMFREMSHNKPLEAVWTIRTLRAPVQTALRQVRGKPWLVTLGNVLNELDDKSRPGQRRTVGIWKHLSSFLDDAAHLLAPGGRILAIEPGTRQGGRLVSNLRRLAMDPRVGDDYEELDEQDDFDDTIDPNWRPSHSLDSDDFDDFDDDDDDSKAFQPDFVPLAPCSHAGPCPMLAPRVNAWCHLNTPPHDAPEQLRALSRKAGLDKDSVSMSFVLLQRRGAVESSAQSFAEVSPSSLSPQTLRVRIVSEAFMVPGWLGRARYACSGKGLVLVMNSAWLPAGCLCDVQLTERKDGKSKAIIAVLPGHSTTPSDLAPQAPESRRPFSSKPRENSRESQPDRRNSPNGRSDRRNSPHPVDGPDRKRSSSPNGQAEKTRRPSRPSQPVDPARTPKPSNPGERKPSRNQGSHGPHGSRGSQGPQGSRGRGRGK